MDLKSKRIFGISQLIISIAILFLYTRIGSIGMVYVAITLEFVLGLSQLFMGSVITNKYYAVLSTLIVEGLLLAFYYLLIIPAEIMFVGTYIKFFMFLVPLYAVLQYSKGFLQAVSETQICAITDLVFWITSVLGTVISYFIFGNYGVKAAVLMQSVKLDHFYVILCLVPGFSFGLIVTMFFVFGVSRMHYKEILQCKREYALLKENKFAYSFFVLKEQISQNGLQLLRRVPILLLLILSVKEIKQDNYLFGHLYGAVLPIFMLMWQLFSIPLIAFKKRLYVLFRRRETEQYERELHTVLSYVFVYCIYFAVCVIALHKSYLAIWSLQTSSAFMALMKSSAVIACFGFLAQALFDILQERNMKRESNLSMISGIVLSAITSAICHKFLGVGVALYVTSIAVGLFVMILLQCWFLYNGTSVDYFYVLKRTYRAIILNIFLCLILIIIENLIFTAFGGVGTIVICLLFSHLFFRVGIYFLGIFSKEERKLLSFKYNIKSILGILKQNE